MAVFAYLTLQLYRKGAKNVYEGQDRLYFTYESQTYFVEEIDDTYWLMVNYTHQHNAAPILNSAISYGKGQWYMIIRELDSPI